MTIQVKSPMTVNQEELEQRVKKMYREVALAPDITYHFEMGRALAERLGYPAEKLNHIPIRAIESFAGVGYYFDLAEIQEGEVVVDLGSGSGMDAFYASLQVGKRGEVIGIDMTKEQLEKSKQIRNQFHFDQVNFVESYIEKPSIVSRCVDVVISNGVINLSSQKEKVFEEIARILKPGGRLAIADIVTTHPLPEAISCDASLWAACIGGAITESHYVSLIEQAGLIVKAVQSNPYAFLSKGAQGATRDYGIKSVSILAVKPQ